MPFRSPPQTYTVWEQSRPTGTVTVDMVATSPMEVMDTKDALAQLRSVLPVVTAPAGAIASFGCTPRASAGSARLAKSGTATGASEAKGQSSIRGFGLVELLRATASSTRVQGM